MNARLTLLVTVALSCALAACETAGRASDLEKIEANVAKNGMYWQRTNATSAIWMQGPKAQQVLNRDISRCVTELGELERLGQIKAAFPADKKDTKETADGARMTLMDWDSPERDGYLLVEPGQYQDFEACMVDKGWERTQYVPYDAAKRAGKAYVENHVDLKSRTKHEQRGQMDEKKGPYDNLND
jgi:hypothetical protein